VRVAVARPPAVQYVSFKAGRCDVADKGNNKFLITPDKRKGQVLLVKVGV
jgi:hypothetical protein